MTNTNEINTELLTKVTNEALDGLPENAPYECKLHALYKRLGIKNTIPDNVGFYMDEPCGNGPCWFTNDEVISCCDFFTEDSTNYCKSKDLIQMTLYTLVADYYDAIAELANFEYISVTPFRDKLESAQINWVFANCLEKDNADYYQDVHFKVTEKVVDIPKCLANFINSNNTFDLVALLKGE